LKNSKPIISERRQRVWTCLTRGMNREEIAKELGVNTSTISRDVQYLAVESQNYLNDLAKTTLPFNYGICLDGIRNIIKQAYLIYDNIVVNDDTDQIKTSDRIMTLRLIKDCHESIFELLNSGPSIMRVQVLEDKLAQLERETQLQQQQYSNSNNITITR
jgi:IS30 family transposase